jgi:hypothetical protein
MHSQGWMILAILIAIPAVTHLLLRKPLALVVSIGLSYFIIGLLVRFLPDRFALGGIEPPASSLDQYYQTTSNSVWFSIATLFVVLAVITGLLTLIKAMFYPKITGLLFEGSEESDQEFLRMLQLGGEADTLVIVCSLCIAVLFLWCSVRRLFGRKAEA